jgi:hypothetical protein
MEPWVSRQCAGTRSGARQHAEQHSCSSQGHEHEDADGLESQWACRMRGRPIATLRVADHSRCSPGAVSESGRVRAESHRSRASRVTYEELANPPATGYAIVAFGINPAPTTAIGTTATGAAFNIALRETRTVWLPLPPTWRRRPPATTAIRQKLAFAPTTNSQTSNRRLVPRTPMVAARVPAMDRVNPCGAASIDRVPRTTVHIPGGFIETCSFAP